MTQTLDITRPPAAPAATSPPLLAVRNIEVVYDDVILVLRGLSLEVPKGAIVALLGANGAGKSTTLKAISGLLKTEDGEVTRGEIIFDGSAIAGIDPDKIVRRGIFQVMEGRRIVADMTSLENLKLGAFTRNDREVDADLDVTILLVEQNARAALSVASHGYIMEQGKVVLDGTADELRDNEDVKEFYLGGGGDQRKSFKNLKSFKRRKRWL